MSPRRDVARGRAAAEPFARADRERSGLPARPARAPPGSGTPARGGSRRSPRTRSPARPPFARAKPRTARAAPARISFGIAVRGVADQRVPEPEASSPGRSSAPAAIELLADERHAGAGRRAAGLLAARARRPLRARTPSDHRGAFDHRALLGLEAVEPRGEQRVDRAAGISSRSRRVVAVGRASRSICSTKSGLPSAASVMPRRASSERAPPRRAGRRAALGLVLGERLERDRGRVRRAVQRGRVVEQLGPREAEQQDRRVAAPAGEVLDQVEEGRLRPVDVVEARRPAAARARASRAGGGPPRTSPRSTPARSPSADRAADALGDSSAASSPLRAALRSARAAIEPSPRGRRARRSRSGQNVMPSPYGRQRPTAPRFARRRRDELVSPGATCPMPGGAEDGDQPAGALRRRARRTRRAARELVARGRRSASRAAARTPARLGARPSSCHASTGVAPCPSASSGSTRLEPRTAFADEPRRRRRRSGSRRGSRGLLQPRGDVDRVAGDEASGPPTDRPRRPRRC